MTSETETATDEASGEVRESATRRSTSRPDDGVGDAVAFAETLEGDSRPSGPYRSSLPPGTLLENLYRIEREIGRGGMGAVYLAEHVTLGRSFAVKVIGSDEQMNPESVKRLIQEARTASSIEHENIIDVTHLGADRDTGLVFVVMELLRGEDMRATLERQVEEGDEPWLADEEVRAIAAQFLSALEAAHAAGIVHRDLKPENVFLARRSGGPRVKVLDFGMSKISLNEGSVRLTKTGQIIGTPLYMPPEQSAAATETDARSDVYSLGVMLYEMLAGEVPFPVETIYGCILAHATKQPPPLGPRRPDLPPAVLEVVHRCLEKEPDSRFDDAGALRDAWDQAWDNVRPAPAPTPTAEPKPAASAQTTRVEVLEAEPPPAPPTSRPWMPIAVGVALVLAVGAGYALSGARDDSTTTPRIAADPAPPESQPIAQPEAAAQPEALAIPDGELPPELEEVAATRTVMVRTRPAGADVLEGGEVIGETPYALEVTEGAPARALTLRRRGHRPEAIEASFESPESLDTTLRRRGHVDDLATW